MDVDFNEFIDDSLPSEGFELDLGFSKQQKGITNLPDDFKIRTTSDIRTLEEYIAHEYTIGIKLYRGHESKDYKLESTIVRLLKQKNKCCTLEDIVTAEQKGLDLFCKYVFKDEWLKKTKPKGQTTIYLKCLLEDI